jgi:CheY-like chemotaxis protein
MDGIWSWRSSIQERPVQERTPASGRNAGRLCPIRRSVSPPNVAIRLGNLCTILYLSSCRLVAAVGNRVVQNELLVVLVVEDEASIQGLIEDALSEGGFKSEIISSGEEAVTLLQGRREEYRALITDINLSGGLTGWDVARRARELHPEFPVIYMSGASAEQWTSQGVPNSLLLTKPFAPAQIVTAVSQLLNQLPPAAHE